MGFIEDHIAYVNRLENSLKRINDLDLFRKRLTYIRWKVSENLDKLLFEFETNVKKNDAQVFWCPDPASAMENLNRHLKSYNKVKFFGHNAVRQLVRELDMKSPEETEQPEAVVIGAKFIMANTGNFFSSFRSYSEYETLLGARKIIVVAGIDSVLALQSELAMARQLYALFETGGLHYEAGILSRAGRIRGISAEVTIMLTDLNKSRLLENPVHRPLFSLLNFDMPPVCPMEQIAAADVKGEKDALGLLLHAFTHGVKENSGLIENNYGLYALNRYIPYDIDLYEQVLDARAYLHKDEKSSLFGKLLDRDRSSILFQPGKFADHERFQKFAERNFFGK